ncbi:DUF1214 domain-containing protein [Variovorax ureilyticus]|uniref:DUF1214 domain-containing protein n=1 Tax=Variovorax ureilyticus TaxID=1836198 RepID=A0ABU8VK16_9BURK
MYNEHHFFHPNPLKRYSPGTENKNLERNSDGSLTLYVSAKSPGNAKETNWLLARFPAGPLEPIARAAECGRSGPPAARVCKPKIIGSV